MDLRLREQHVFASVWVLLKIMFPLFLQIVLHDGGLFLNLRPQRVHCFSVLHRDFTLYCVNLEWINFGNNHAFFDIDYVDIDVLSTFHRHLWLLLLFMTNFRSYF